MLVNLFKKACSTFLFMYVFTQQITLHICLALSSLLGSREEKQTRNKVPDPRSSHMAGERDHEHEYD